MRRKEIIREIKREKKLTVTWGETRTHDLANGLPCSKHSVVLRTGSSKFSLLKSLIFHENFLDSHVFIPVTDALK